jgi:ribonuclease J
MSKKLELISYGPENTIGGNCLELILGKSNILFDCGVNYFPFADLPIPPWTLPEEWLSKIGFYPLFEEKKAKNINLLLLSHPHVDHYGSIPCLLKSFNLKAMWCGDFALYKINRFLYGFFKKEHKIMKKFESVIHPDVNTLVSGSFMRDVRIYPIKVDHSTLDCYGFLVRTRDYNIFYTGDFESPVTSSWGARNGYFLYKSGSRLEKFKINLLITEGTLLGQSSKGIGELEVKKLIKETINLTIGPVVIVVSTSNLKRIKTILDTVPQLRKIYVSSYFANNVPIDRLNISKDSLQRIVVCKDGVKITDLDDAPPFSDTVVLLGLEEVFSQWHLSLLTKNEKLWARPSTYILSVDVQYQIYHNKILEILTDFLRKNGINIVEAHARGHIDTLDLIKLVEELNPSVIIPIHTQHPEYLKKYFPTQTIIPKQCIPIIL